MVSTTLVVLGAIAAVLISVLRRRAWLGIQALLVIVGANLTTQLVKDWYDRPHVLTGWTGQNSLPSGHTTVVAAASVALLLTVSRRWRWVVAVIGAAWTWLTGLSTLVGRWHRPADVVAALLVACFWGALACLLRSQRSLDSPIPRLDELPAVPHRYRKGYPPTRVTMAIFGGLAALGTVIAIVALIRLYGLEAAVTPDNTLVDIILAEGELTAYIGGIAAVSASVFGVFGVLLWLRDATLKADNSRMFGYGASAGQHFAPQPALAGHLGNGASKGEM